MGLSDTKQERVSAKMMMHAKSTSGSTGEDFRKPHIQRIDHNLQGSSFKFCGIRVNGQVYACDLGITSAMSGIQLRDDTLDRIVRAVEKVRERLLRAASALSRAGIDYAIAGGNAVAVWVAQVDEGAVRNTRDVDILVRRDDLSRVRVALEEVGFVYRHLAEIDLFVDGESGSPREGVHLLFAGEMVRPEEAATNPKVTESQQGREFRVLTLEALVRVKLTAYRKKDQVHLLDMLELGLIDETWCGRFAPVLADRLRELVKNPE